MTGCATLVLRCESVTTVVMVVALLAATCSGKNYPFASTFISSNSLLSGIRDGVQGSATIGSASSACMDGNDIVFVDSTANSIRRYVAATKSILTVAGSTVAGTADGTGTAARFNGPTSIIKVGQYFYLSDTGNNCVRRIAVSDYAVTTFSGICGSNSGAFRAPRGLAYWSGMLLVADSQNSAVKAIVISNQFLTTFLSSQGSFVPGELAVGTSKLYIEAGQGFYSADLVAGQSQSNAVLIANSLTTNYLSGFALDGDRIIFCANLNDFTLTAFDVNTHTLTDLVTWTVEQDIDGNPPSFASINSMTMVSSDAMLVIEKYSLRRVVLTVPTKTKSLDLPTPVPSTAVPSTAAPSTAVPTTAVPSTAVPSTAVPTTTVPSTATPSTAAPSTAVPTTAVPSTATPSTAAPSTATPSTAAPSTAVPSTAAPSTAVPSTVAPSTAVPSTAAPSTATPSTAAPSTAVPSTAAPSTAVPSTVAPSTAVPSTAAPSTATPSTAAPSTATPSTAAPSTAVPSTAAPSTAVPSTVAPSTATPSTAAPSTATPSTAAPSTATPSTAAPSTAVPSTATPSTAVPSTATPSTAAPSTAVPSTAVPVTGAPTTATPSTVPSTAVPVTGAPTAAPTTAAPTATGAPLTAAPVTTTTTTSVPETSVSTTGAPVPTVVPSTTQAPLLTTSVAPSTLVPSTFAPPVTVGFPSSALPLSNATAMALFAAALRLDLVEAFGDSSVIIENVSGVPTLVSSVDGTLRFSYCRAPSGVTAAVATATIQNATLSRTQALLDQFVASGVVVGSTCRVACVGNCTVNDSASSSGCISPTAPPAEVLEPAVRNGAIAAAVVLGLTGIILFGMMMTNAELIGTGLLLFPLS